MAVKGDLQLFHPIEVFQLIKSNKETGVLLISSSGLLGGIYFVEGDVAYATTAKKMYDFFSKKKFTNFLRALKEEGSNGALWHDVVTTLLNVMGLTRGTFAFEEASFFIEDNFEPVLIPSEFVIMEATRQLQDWDVVGRKISSLQLVFEKRDGWEDMAKKAELTPEEMDVLDAVDGERSVEKIIEVIGRPSKEVTKVLFGLLCAGIIGRARRRPKLEKRWITRGLLKRLIKKIRGL
jgi:hypothetical protein